MIVYVFVVSLLALSPITVTITAKSCKPLGDHSDSPFVTKKNEYQIDYNSTNNEEGSVVSAKCHNPSYILNGPPVRVCKDGTWTGTELNCTQAPPSPPPTQSPSRMRAILGGTLGGVVFVLVSIILVIVLIRCLKKRNLQKRDQQGQLIKDDNNKRLFKIWTADRKGKLFIWASTLRNLAAEAANVFKKPGTLRIVLEEDGTEVTTDNILSACVEKTFVVLADGEIWWDANAASNDGDVTRRRLTFDVCSKDRQKRKLFLAESLLDLFQQGMIFFAYRPTRACIEKDGTLIEDDNVLFASAGSTIMLLASQDYWMPSVDRSSSGSLSKILVESNSGEHPIGKRLFKVWSEDKKTKLAVVADSLAGLHLAAAKAHGLQNPIEICILSSGETITRDTQLDENIDEILFVRNPLNAFKSSSSVYQYIDPNDADGRTEVSTPHDYTYSRPTKYPRSNKRDFQSSISSDYQKNSNYYETLPELEKEKKKGWYSDKTAGNLSNVREVKGLNERENIVPNGHGLYDREPTDSSSNRVMIESNFANTKTNNRHNAISPRQLARQQRVGNGSAIPMEDLRSESREVLLRELGNMETFFEHPQDLSYKNSRYAYSDTNAEDNFDLMRKQNERKNGSKLSLQSRNRGSILVTGGEGISSHINSDVLF